MKTKNRKEENMAEKAESKVTVDPEEIRRWAEARGGKPAVVKGTDILRINFPGGAEEELQDISWEEFFQKFEEKGLAFLYQEKKPTGSRAPSISLSAERR